MTFELCPPEWDIWLPTPEPGTTWDVHTVHTHYFGFSVPEAAIASFIYARYQPGANSMQGGLSIFRGHDNLEQQEVDYLDYQSIMGWPTVSEDGRTIRQDNGLTFEFLELGGGRIRIRYESPDGTTRLDLEQRGVTPFIARGKIVPTEVGSAGAPPSGGGEQIMHVTGTLVLDGEEFAVDCFNYRDRSLNKLRLEGRQPGPPIACNPMYFGEDLALNSVSYEAPDTNPPWLATCPVDPDAPTHMYGWAQIDGELEQIVRVHRTCTERHPILMGVLAQDLEIETAGGKVRRFHGENLNFATVPAWPTSTLRSAVMRWEDEQGRVTHDTYQEQWFDHRFMKATRAQRLAG